MSLIMVVIAWSILRYKNYSKMVQDGTIKDVFKQDVGGIAMVTNPAAGGKGGEGGADAM